MKYPKACFTTWVLSEFSNCVCKYNGEMKNA